MSISVPISIPKMTKESDLGLSQSPGDKRSHLDCMTYTGNDAIDASAGAFASVRNRFFSHFRYTLPTPSAQTAPPTLSCQIRSRYHQLSEWTFTHSSKITAFLQTLSSDLPIIIPNPKPFFQFFSICGLGASAIDCLVEPYGIGKNFQFLSTHSLWRKPQANLSPVNLANSLQKIHESYFEVPKEKQELWTKCAIDHLPLSTQGQLCYVSQEKKLYLYGQKLELGKCMGHRFTETLEKTLPALIHKLHAKKPSEDDVQEARDLLNKIRLQAYKSCVIRSIGLAGAILTALFFIFTGFMLMGGVFPLALAALGSVLYLFRFILAATWPEINGWRFSLKTAAYHTVIQPVQSALRSLQKSTQPYTKCGK